MLKLFFFWARERKRERGSVTSLWGMCPPCVTLIIVKIDDWWDN